MSLTLLDILFLSIIDPPGLVEAAIATKLFTLVRVALL